MGFTQPSYTTVEEAGSVILLVTSDGNNPDPVVISYDMNEENLQGVVVLLTVALSIFCF